MSEQKMVRMTVQIDVPYADMDKLADQLGTAIGSLDWRTTGYSYRAAGTPWGVGSVHPRRLYEWLGTQIEVSRKQDEENEHCVNLDESVGHGYHAEAFAEVRRHMRRFDKSLPKSDVDRI